MEDQRYVRAAILFQQHRFAEAERELRDLLTGDPARPDALHLLAAAMYQQDRYAEARLVAGQLLGLHPDSADAHGLLARIELADGAAAKAEMHARQAVELEPGRSTEHGVLAFVLLRRLDLERALESADRGLAIDPEDLQCLNIRAEVLARLGRKEEADRTIGKSLELDPENPYTHSNTGWAMLRRGDAPKALEHFREALRRDPMNEHAKAGLVEALKARYLVYRLWLRYVFWVSNLKGNVQFLLVVGFYILNRVLSGLIDQYPALGPVLWPLLIAYLLFAISTWILTPLSNLLLRLNPYGRLALDREGTLSSTFAGATLGISLLALLAWACGAGPTALTLAGVAFLMMIPFGSMFTEGRYRSVLIGASVVIALLGLLAVWATSTSGIVITRAATWFLTAQLIYQFGSGLLRSRD